MADVLWEKPSDTGVYSGGNWLATGGLALGNLKTQDVMELARSVDLAPSSTQWRIDFGRIAPINMMAMLNHNGSVTARRRYVVTNSADNSGPPVYDSGFERMRLPTVVWGAKPFGAFPFDGVDMAAYPAGPYDLHFAPDIVYGRYLFTFVADTDNPSGYFQAGRFMAGQAWRHRHAYGVKVRPVDPSVVRRTRGGRRIIRALPKYREITITFEHMQEVDAWTNGFEIDRAGKAGDFLIIVNSDDDPSIRFRRAIYASLVDTGGVTNTSVKRYSWSITAEELI